MRVPAFPTAALRPTLRRYQNRAVTWMIERENLIPSRDVPARQLRERELHPLLTRLKSTKEGG
ncbi:hypothetical protein T484DRAFT_1820053 [Baffinella frigidus]|nr:hypothetical protein T484DRAFT_1820053 [Cryptophyta sp. CCMP2293]